MMLARSLGGHCRGQRVPQRVQVDASPTFAAGQQVLLAPTAPSLDSGHHIDKPPAHGHIGFQRAGNSPVSLFELWGDTHGWGVEPDRDDGTRIRAHFRNVQIEIVEAVDCA